MFKLILLGVIFFKAVGDTMGYTCSCSCYSNSYSATAYSSVCSSTSCQSACSFLSYCLTYSDTVGTCSDSDWIDSSYSVALGVGAIVGIVVGVLSGLGFLIFIIVMIVILCKRKRARVLAVQTQQPQQAMMQSGIVNAPGQVWGYNNAYQYPPNYPSTQPFVIQT